MDASPETLNPDTAQAMRLRVAFVDWLAAVVLVISLAWGAVRFESGALGWLHMLVDVIGACFTNS